VSASGLGRGDADPSRFERALAWGDGDRPEDAPAKDGTAAPLAGCIWRPPPAHLLMRLGWSGPVHVKTCWRRRS